MAAKGPKLYFGSGSQAGPQRGAGWCPRRPGPSERGGEEASCGRREQQERSPREKACGLRVRRRAEQLASDASRDVRGVMSAARHASTTFRVSSRSPRVLRIRAVGLGFGRCRPYPLGTCSAPRPANHGGHASPKSESAQRLCRGRITRVGCSTAALLQKLPCRRPASVPRSAPRRRPPTRAHAGRGTLRRPRSRLHRVRVIARHAMLTAPKRHEMEGCLHD